MFQFRLLFFCVFELAANCCSLSLNLPHTTNTLSKCYNPVTGCRNNDPLIHLFNFNTEYFPLEQAALKGLLSSKVS